MRIVTDVAVVRRSGAQLLLGALLATVLVANAVAQQCAVPTSTLAFSCGTSCLSTQPCMRKSSTSCDLECFAVDVSEFAFLIPYDATVGDTLTTPFKSNSVLTKVAKLTLPNATTAVILRGGSSLTASKHATVAKVEIEEDFLASSPQVTQLQLANMDLGTAVAKLVPNFPRQLTKLSLANDLLQTFPLAVTDFKALEELVLGDNLITQVDSSHEIATLTLLQLSVNAITSFTALYPKLTYLDLAYNKLGQVPAVIPQHTKLTTLHLSVNKIADFTQKHAVESLETLGLFGNNLATFDVYLPNLVSLYLNDNKFKEFPPAIFKLTNLQELYMDANALLQNVTLTNAQANFVETLKTFVIDPTAFSTSCAKSQQATVKKLPVCITGGAVDLSVIQGPRIVSPAPSPTSSTPSSSASGGSKTPSANGISTDETPSNSSSKNDNNTLLIAVGCAAGILALALLAGFVYWRRQRTSWKRRATSDVVVLGDVNDDGKAGESANYTGATRSTESPHPSDFRHVVTALWNDPDLIAVKVSSDDIQDVRRLGSGAFCDVWLVTYRKTQRLAAKRLREVTRRLTQQFIDEIKLVAVLTHPRVVSFIGAAWTKETDLQALFEFMDGGDLRSYLEGDYTPRMWTLEKLQIAVDVAEALVYVHSFNPPLVHRDLKSRNILLGNDAGGAISGSVGRDGDDDGRGDATIRAKLTDFGVSRYESEQQTMTAGVGTGKWLAPEVIVGDGAYGAPADIFSFGVVLSELDTHALPYDGARGSNGNRFAPVALLQFIANGELRPSFSESCPPKILDLAQQCLSLRPSDRPSAPEVAYALRSFMKSVSRR